MYPVSEAFQKAIRKPQRQTRVTGTLKIRESDGSWTTGKFDDDAIIQDSLTIIDQMSGGKFGFGGAYIRNMSVKLDCDKIEDVDPVNINLTYAQISLWFYLTLEDGTEESLLLGSFIIDAAQSSRKYNVLILKGVDRMSTLDVPSEAMTGATPYEVFEKACALSHKGMGNTQEFIESLPNGTTAVTFDTKQIQTARDMLMWLGDMTGTFVRVKRQDEPCPQLVQIPTKYTKAGTSGNFDLATFKSDNGSIIPADVRYSTEFTDTSVRITTVFMNVDGEEISNHQDWNLTVDTLEGTMELDSNPMIKSLGSDGINTVITNLRDYLDGLRFAPFKTTFNGNPAIEVGDYVYLEPGGAVDETNFYHYGIVTYSKWKYRGKCEIRCQTDATTERQSSSSSTSAASTNAVATLAAIATATTTETTSDTMGINAKSQLEKRVDALSGGSLSDRIVSSGGQTLTIGQGAMYPTPEQTLEVCLQGEQIYFKFGDTRVITISPYGITISWFNDINTQGQEIQIDEYSCRINGHSIY